MANYLLSFKRGDGKFRVWRSSTEKITAMPMLPPGDGKIRKFLMFNHNDNEATDEDLEE
jgi:hypothetical protein